MEWLAELLQFITPPFLILVVVVVLALLVIRTFRNVQVNFRTVPLLQARDLLTFVYFAVLVGAQQYVRATGFALGKEAWWIVLTDVLAIGVGAFWLLVELGILGRTRGDK